MHSTMGQMAGVVQATSRPDPRQIAVRSPSAVAVRGRKAGSAGGKIATTSTRRGREGARSVSSYLENSARPPWGDRLRQWRVEVRCWSQQELVDQIVRLAFEGKEDRGTRLEVRLLAKWESGEVRKPHPTYRRLLTRLGAPSPDELLVKISQEMHNYSLESALPPKSIESNVNAFGPARAYDDPDPVEARRRALHEFFADGGVSGASLDDWDMTVVHYAVAAKDREPSLLLADLVADFDELQSILSRCRSSSSLRRLTRVAAQLSGLTCLTLIKLEERQAFRRWARTARLAAAEVGDPATHAWVLAQEAYGHFYSRDLNEAVAVAQHAQEISLRSVVVS